MWWKACPQLGQSAAVPYVPFGDLSNSTISRWPKPCQLGHVLQGLIIKGAVFLSCDEREPSSTAHPLSQWHTTQPLHLGFHRQRLDWQRWSVTGIQQCLFSNLLSWLVAAFFWTWIPFATMMLAFFTFFLSIFPAKQKYPRRTVAGRGQRAASVS